MERRFIGLHQILVIAESLRSRWIPHTAGPNVSQMGNQRLPHLAITGAPRCSEVQCGSIRRPVKIEQNGQMLHNLNIDVESISMIRV